MTNIPCPSGYPLVSPKIVQTNFRNNICFGDINSTNNSNFFILDTQLSKVFYNNNLIGYFIDSRLPINSSNISKRKFFISLRDMKYLSVSYTINEDESFYCKDYKSTSIHISSDDKYGIYYAKYIGNNSFSHKMNLSRNGWESDNIILDLFKKKCCFEVCAVVRDYISDRYNLSSDFILQVDYQDFLKYLIGRNLNDFVDIDSIFPDSFPKFNISNSADLRNKLFTYKKNIFILISILDGLIQYNSGNSLFEGIFAYHSYMKNLPSDMLRDKKSKDKILQQTYDSISSIKTQNLTKKLSKEIGVQSYSNINNLLSVYCRLFESSKLVGYVIKYNTNMYLISASDMNILQNSYNFKLDNKSSIPRVSVKSVGNGWLSIVHDEFHLISSSSIHYSTDTIQILIQSLRYNKF